MTLGHTHPGCFRLAANPTQKLSSYLAFRSLPYPRIPERVLSLACDFLFIYTIFVTSSFV